jgi:hypothetical protein
MPSPEQPDAITHSYEAYVVAFVNSSTRREPSASE